MDSRDELCNDFVSKDDKNAISEVLINSKTELASTNAKFVISNMPEDMDLNVFVPVYIAAVETPYKFWFVPQHNEFVRKAYKRDEEINAFYSLNCDKCIMKDEDLKVGAHCVVQSQGDKEYYRGIIKKILSPDLIRVLFIDFGGYDIIPRNSVYYVWKKLIHYPATTFYGRLAFVKPPRNECCWSYETSEQFSKMSRNKIFMAFLRQIGINYYEVNLCNTDGEEDTYIHSKLIESGLAEFNLRGQDENILSQQNNRHSNEDKRYTVDVVYFISYADRYENLKRHLFSTEELIRSPTIRERMKRIQLSQTVILDLIFDILHLQETLINIITIKTILNF